MAVTKLPRKKKDVLFVRRGGPLKLTLCREKPCAPAIQSQSQHLHAIYKLREELCDTKISGTVRRQDIGSVYTFAEKELGRGNFGVTYLCEHKVRRELYACKSIDKVGVTLKMTQYRIKNLEKEIQIMERLAAEDSIVRLKEVYEDEDKVHLVMELCVGGELVCKRGHYGETEAASICRKIVEGVQACHSAGVMHRDLKLQNILFATTDADSPIKLIDFGLSVFFKQGEVFKQMVGCRACMAPEVYTENYGKEVDLWSAGVILYVLLSGAYPFRSSAMTDIREAVLKGDLDFACTPWHTISDGAKDLVKKMLERDPKKRLTASDILIHPWILKSGEGKCRDEVVGPVALRHHSLD